MAYVSVGGKSVRYVPDEAINRAHELGDDDDATGLNAFKLYVLLVARYRILEPGRPATVARLAQETAETTARISELRDRLLAHGWITSDDEGMRPLLDFPERSAS